MAVRGLVALALVLVVVNGVPLSTQYTAHEELSVQTPPAQAKTMTQEELAELTNGILLKANTMRRLLNHLGISDADTVQDIEKRFDTSQLGESASIKSHRDEALGARACINS